MLLRFVAVTMLFFAGPMSAQAQNAAQPSLASPAKPTRTKAHARTAAKPAPKGPDPWQVVDPARAAQPVNGAGPTQAAPSSVESHRKPVDPIEFGGKWNAANDDAEKTRVQNYNGDAVGTGGEVGFKLHF